MILFPNEIESLKIKYTIICPQINKSKTKTKTFSEEKNGHGWGNYCLTNQFIENGPLSIICVIQIIELNNQNALELINSKIKRIGKVFRHEFCGMQSQSKCNWG